VRSRSARLFVDGERVQRRSVRIVPFEWRRNALLDDEDGMPHEAERRLVPTPRAGANRERIGRHRW
jgi:hypothetical protein